MKKSISKKIKKLVENSTKIKKFKKPIDNKEINYKKKIMIGNRIKKRRKIYHRQKKNQEKKENLLRKKNLEIKII
jgi:hypothetical protein